MITSKVRNLFLGSLLLSVIGGSASAAISPENEKSTGTSAMVTQKPKIVKWEKAHQHQCGMFAQAWLGVGDDKHLSADDAKRIAEAALIWYGERSLKVGNVIAQSKDKGQLIYFININDQHDQLVRQISMNSKTGQVHLVSQEAP